MEYIKYQRRDILIVVTFRGTVFGLESANIVGYSATPVTGGGLYCIGMQFADVGASSDMATISKLSASGLTPSTWNDMETGAPCIMFYNGVGYDFYYYISDAYDADGNEVTAWANAGGDEALETKSLGTGCWLSLPAGTATEGSITSSGEVSDAATSTVTINNGLSLITNPYPMGFNPGAIVTTGLTPSTWNDMETEAPCIMVYNGVGYDFYYYISDAYDADGNEVTAWANAGGDAVNEEIAGVGEAFWVKTTSAGSFTFSK